MMEHRADRLTGHGGVMGDSKVKPGHPSHRAKLVERRPKGSDGELEELRDTSRGLDGASSEDGDSAWAGVRERQDHPVG